MGTIKSTKSNTTIILQIPIIFLIHGSNLNLPLLQIHIRTYPSTITKKMVTDTTNKARTWTCLDPDYKLLLEIAKVLVHPVLAIEK